MEGEVLLAPHGLLHQGLLGKVGEEVREACIQDIDVGGVYRGWSGAGVQVGAQYIHRGHRHCRGAVGVLVEHVEGTGASVQGELDGVMGLEHVLLELNPGIEHVLAHRAGQVAGAVADKLNLVLALLAAHQADKVLLPAVALYVSVQMALLGEGFVADAAGERFLKSD